MTTQPSLFDIPVFGPNEVDAAEVLALRAKVAALEAELAALRKPAKPKPPFRMTDTHRRLLALMQDGEWHLWTELVQPHMGGSRAPGRLAELQDAGLLRYTWEHVKGSRLTAYRMLRADEVTP